MSVVKIFLKLLIQKLHILYCQAVVTILTSYSQYTIMLIFSSTVDSSCLFSIYTTFITIVLPSVCQRRRENNSVCSSHRL